MKEEESERFDEILIGRRDTVNRKDLLKYIRSNFEGLSLRNIESHQNIILPIQKEISEIVEDKL